MAAGSLVLMSQLVPELAGSPPRGDAADGGDDAAEKTGGRSEPSAVHDVERRLLAILSADVVGYSRLMESDEQRTLHRLRALRGELIAPALRRYQGRLIKEMGDGFLVAFSSALHAVRCAIDLQVATRSVPPDPETEAPLRLRIGVNLGDVVAEGDELYGDGINVATRLEQLAEPGDVYLSDVVRASMGGRLDVKLVDLGERSLKNIARPVRIHRVDLGTRTPLEAPSACGGLEKPSIAVLPFERLGAGPHEDFEQGLAEEIVVSLAHSPWFSVIAHRRETGEGRDALALARSLGAQYLIDGSVRSSGRRIRVSARLVEVASGAHVWAQRYDREEDDVFDVQDAICADILASMPTEFLSAEMHRAQRKDTSVLDAWDCTMRARWHLTRFCREDNQRAQALVERAIELDATSAASFSYLAMIRLTAFVVGWSPDKERTLQEASDAACVALHIDPHDAVAQCALGQVDAYRGDLDSAVARTERVIAAHPTLSLAHGCLGAAYMLQGAHDLARRSLEHAIGLCAADHFLSIWLTSLATTAFLDGDAEESLAWAERAIDAMPDSPYPTVYAIQAAAEASLGWWGPAARTLEALARAVPGVTIERFVRSFAREVDRARLRKALTSAGMTDH